ncbi:MAG: hypothetical protein LBL62_01740 [Planctomycetaceae bacterium]|nr:hypothetical protein [Planctomycetaceae bacterium]
MNQINNGNWYCRWFWNPIAKRNQGQSRLCRRNLLTNSERLPTSFRFVVSLYILKTYRNI